MAWLIPALKAVLPHMGTIINAARPIFTKPEADEAVLAPDVLERQIAELQEAAAHNDANVRELANQLENALKAIEEFSLAADEKNRRLSRICFASLAVAVVALGLAFYALYSH